jgi:hypothetical protein
VVAFSFFFLFFTQLVPGGIVEDWLLFFFPKCFIAAKFDGYYFEHKEN